MKFAAAVNCMDGRAQLPVINFITQNYGVDYVDKITKAGPSKYLSSKHKSMTDLIIKKVNVSIDKHGSEKVFIAGHHDCAGNPVDKETHIQQIIDSKKILEERLSNDIEVIALWLDENFEVSLV